MAPRRIVFVVYPGCQSLDLTGPYEVFAGANAVLADGGRALRYRMTIAGPAAGPVRTESGLGIVADAALSAVRAPVDDLIVVGGFGSHAAAADGELLHHLRRLSLRADRIISVCTGSFVLAAAGLLDGRTACTHWARAALFHELFPGVGLDASSLYRRDGNVWTSAGVTAGIDLSLALVESDCGATVAQTVARWLVMFLRRPGGQTQFAASVWHDASEIDSIRSVQDAVLDDPSADHRIASLAIRAHMSERNFVRVFTREVGATPAKFVESVRVDAACHALETTSAGVDTVARTTGFGTAETMRRAFLRRRGVTPSDHRDRFRLSPAV